MFAFTDGSCDSHDECATDEYCVSNTCVSTCENSLDCPNGVCRDIMVESELLRLCKDECSDTSDSCDKGDVCVGKKSEIFILFSKCNTLDTGLYLLLLNYIHSYHWPCM